MVAHSQPELSACKWFVLLVTPARFELATSGLGNRCSIHLSYGATFAVAGREKPANGILAQVTAMRLFTASGNFLLGQQYAFRPAKVAPVATVSAKCNHLFSAACEAEVSIDD